MIIIIFINYNRIIFFILHIIKYYYIIINKIIMIIIIFIKFNLIIFFDLRFTQINFNFNYLIFNYFL